jgi:hypothetical protein
MERRLVATTVRHMDHAQEKHSDERSCHGRFTQGPEAQLARANVNVWLQSRSLPARGRVGLEVHRCLCIIDAGIVFISTVMG